MSSKDNATTKEMTRSKRQAGLMTRSGFHTDHDARRLIAQIPNDTRTLTGRVLGDPLPGRSALDRRCA